jgi:hypothetical protein
MSPAVELTDILYKNCKLSSAETNLSLILKERIFIE